MPLGGQEGKREKPKGKGIGEGEGRRKKRGERREERESLPLNSLLVVAREGKEKGQREEKV